MKSILVIVCFTFLFCAFLHAQPVFYGASKTAIIKYDIASGSYTILAELPGKTIRGGLIRATDGKLYGLADSARKVIIFSFDVQTKTYKTELSQVVYENGELPAGGLVQARDGKLYAVTSDGGTSYLSGSRMKGVIFSFDPVSKNFSKLFDFNSSTGGIPQAGLMQASDGKLYGTTTDDPPIGSGSIFSFDPISNSFSSLNSFKTINGSQPMGRLLQAANGKLYGTTYYGSAGSSVPFGTSGIIYSYDPTTGAFIRLHELSEIGAQNPVGALVQASNGKLYGTTYYGGANGKGVLFSLDLLTNNLEKLTDFGSENGDFPGSDLMEARDGKIYGTASGGPTGNGVLFSYAPKSNTFATVASFGGTEGKLIEINDSKTTSSIGSSSAGFSYKYYEGSWDKLPDFGGLVPFSSGRVLNVSLVPRKRDDQFAFLFEGKISIPKAGRYYFETTSDDGSKLYIGHYGHYVTPVVDNDGQHGTETKGGWYSFPSAGIYDIAVTYFEQGGQNVLQVYWGSEEAGIAMHTRIPEGAFGAPATPAPGQWTWAGGDSTAQQVIHPFLGDSLAVRGTKGVPSKNNKPPTRERAAAWTDKEGNFWMFGGKVYAPTGPQSFGFYADIWRFNPSTGEWTWMSGTEYLDQFTRPNQGPIGVPSAGYTPGGRIDMATWVDDEGNFWLMGGAGVSRYPELLNDLWRFNPTTLEWTYFGGGLVSGGPNPILQRYRYDVYGTRGVAAKDNQPAGGPVVAFKPDIGVSIIGADGKFWLLSNVLWQFDPSTLMWTWVSGDTSQITPVYGTKGIPSVHNWPGPTGKNLFSTSVMSGVAWTDLDGLVWLYRAAQMWRYNPSTNEWTFMNDSTAVDGPNPGIVDAPTSWTDTQGRFWLLNNNKLWVYDAVLKQWSMQAGSEPLVGIYGTRAKASPANKPGYRTGAQGWSDNLNRLWLFGGIGYDANGFSGALNDLWLYQPVTIQIKLAADTYCEGSKVSIGVTSNGGFANDNVFTIQLSDESGCFQSPLNIGTIAVSSPGELEAMIPQGIPAGKHYRIRVVSSSPALEGLDNGFDIAINPAPTVAVKLVDAVLSQLPGLSYKYYEGSWDKLPDFGGLSPLATGKVSNISLAPRKRDDQFAFLFEGRISIPKAGWYYLETFSDDGSKLYIGNYGHYITPAVNNDGQHAALLRGGWYHFPNAGQYDIAVSFFEKEGDQQLKVYWGSVDAGITMHTPIPDEAFTQPAGLCTTQTLTASEGDSYLWSTGETTRSIQVDQAGSYTATITKSGCSGSATTDVVCQVAPPAFTQRLQTLGATIPATGLHLAATPNPSNIQFAIRVDGIVPGSSALLVVSDALGRVVEQRTIAADGQLILGAHYRPGVYHLQLVQGINRTAIKIIKAN